MSIQAVAWVLEQDISDPIAKLVMISLANAVNGKNQRCFPCFERIMKESSSSRSSVIRKLKWLEDNGWIAINSEFSPEGRQLANSYSLLMGDREGVTQTPRGVKNREGVSTDTPEGVSTDTPEGVCCETPNKEPEEIPEEVPEDIMSETSSDAPPKPKKQKQSYPEQFENCWKKYPTDQNMSKKEAYDEWKKLSDEDKASLDASIPAFKAFCEKDTTYRPIHMCRYISKRRYDGFKPQEQSQAQITNIDDARWQKFLAYARERREWQTDLWGAMPNHDGCIVPKHLIQPDDGKNWREIKSVKAA